MSVYVLDIETTTDFKNIRLAGLRGPHGSKEYAISPRGMDNLSDFLNTGDTIVGHNICRFDLPMLEKLWGWRIPEGVKLVDTLLLSKIMHPDIYGGHSMLNLAMHYMPDDEDLWKMDVLESGEYDTAEEFYDTAPIGELKAYLDKDLECNYHLWRAMAAKCLDLKKGYGFDFSKPLKLEQKVAEITARQVDRMVAFDVDKAQALWAALNAEMDRIEDDLDRHMPYRPLPPSRLHHPPKAQFKKDGTPSARLIAYCDGYGYEVYKHTDDEWYASNGSLKLKLPLTEPIVQSYKLSLSNQTELKLWLQEMGWVPTMWNIKKEKDPLTGKMVYRETSPRLTDKTTKEPCPNLDKMGITWISDISRWLMLRSRKNVLKSDNGTGWIPSAIANGGFLPSEADTLGANTGRYTHKVIANVPRVTSAFGKEMRSLFMAREGYDLVGWDAASLEACVEAHYVFPYDWKYAETLVSGDSKLGTDVHTLNMKNLGLPNRDVAKTFKYAITYGAQPPTLARQCAVSTAQAKEWFDDFWSKSDGLRQFKEDLTGMWEATGKKYIMGLDGRPISTRSQHSLVNAAFQSAGAIIMKYAFVLADARIRKVLGDRAEGLIRYHDEEQWETTAFADDVGSMGVQSIIDAGKALKLNVPLGGEYKIGRTWADTH